CAMERRTYPPGEHGRMSGHAGRQSDYSRQLRAKQKGKRIYGVLERQFRRNFNEARRRPGLTGLNLLQILETRFDNIVFRAGFAESRSHARQMISHGHFILNDRRNDIPSTNLKPGDRFAVREASKQTEFFKVLRQSDPVRNAPAWIEANLENLSGRVIRLPERAEIDGNLNEQLIVEYYSR
ncbi:MAG: 30S ribosomal protein S4, partial [Anaerolineales bacterium]|nr:30S ribosomal protein S4 [Anaerolineales bacterium]